MTPARAALVALSLSLGLAGAAVPAAMAQSDSATVTVTDAGFSPASVSIPPGGTITWVNKGNNVHSATSTREIVGTLTPVTPASFDSGGLGRGQAFNTSFSTPGTYAYTSAPDCLNGNQTQGFACTVYTISVGEGTAAASAAPAPSITPLGVTPPSSSPPVVPPGAAQANIAQNATITVSENGFSPANVVLAPGGVATFVNQGANVHTAVAIGGAVKMADPRVAPMYFDTGGIAPGQSVSVSFPNEGTFPFTSATDCQNGNNTPTFNCGTQYSITVLKAPVGASASAAVAPPFSGPVVYFKDPAGFDPPTITAKAGQTVTWMNLSNNAHSVASDNPAQPFDSGGLGPGSVFTVTFQQPGSYPYHSSADPAGAFTGTVVVEA